MTDKRTFLKNSLAAMIPAAFAGRAVADTRTDSLLAILFAKDKARDSKIVPHLAAYAGEDQICEGSRENPLYWTRVLETSGFEATDKSHFKILEGGLYAINIRVRFRNPDNSVMYFRKNGTYTESLSAYSIVPGEQLQVNTIERFAAGDVIQLTVIRGGAKAGPFTVSLDQRDTALVITRIS